MKSGTKLFYSVKSMVIIYEDCIKGGIGMEEVKIGEVFTITDDNGEEQEMEVLATMEVESHTYVAVAFVDDIETDSEEDMDIFFLKVEEEGDFAPILSDEEFDKVSKAFETNFDDEA